MFNKYKKIILLIVLIISLFGCRKSTFKIKIILPTKSSSNIIYAEEEISPLSKEIKITSGEWINDKEVVLTNKSSDIEYKTYITPGTESTLDLNKDEWYKIGIVSDNDSDIEKVVYIIVEGIDLRIE